MRKTRLTPKSLVEPRRTLYRPGCHVVLCLLSIGVVLSCRPQCVAQESVARPMSVTRVAKPVSGANKQNPDDSQQMRKTIRRLTTEIESLRKKVAELEKIREFNSVHDRLKTEEQRVVELEDKMMEIAEKEEGLQRRMDDVNEQLRPENIHQLPISGSLRPEQVREAALRRLSNEKEHIQSQLVLIQQNRTRLQASLAVIDLVLPRLRVQLQNSINHDPLPSAEIRPQ